MIFGISVEKLYVGSHPQNTKIMIFNFRTLACDLVLASAAWVLGDPKKIRNALSFARQAAKGDARVYDFLLEDQELASCIVRQAHPAIPASGPGSYLA